MYPSNIGCYSVDAGHPSQFAIALNTYPYIYIGRYSQVAKRIGHPPCIKRPKHCIFETFVWVWVG